MILFCRSFRASKAGRVPRPEAVLCTVSIPRIIALNYGVRILNRVIRVIVCRVAIAFSPPNCFCVISRNLGEYPCALSDFATRRIAILHLSHKIRLPCNTQDTDYSEITCMSSKMHDAENM